MEVYGSPWKHFKIMKTMEALFKFETMEILDETDADQETACTQI